MLKRRRAAEGEEAPGSESASDPEPSKEAHSDGGDDEKEEEQEQDPGPLRDESGPWRCVLCPKALLLGPSGLRQHIESKRHRKRLGNASEGDVPEGGPIINAKAFDRLTARVEAERAAVGGEEAETHAERLERLRSLAKGNTAGAEEAPGAEAEQDNPQAEGKGRRKRRREEGKRPRKG